MAARAAAAAAGKTPAAAAAAADAPPRWSEAEGDTAADDVDSVLATLQKWTPEERAAYVEAAVDGVDVDGDRLHPLFMTSSPSEAVVKSNSVLSALTTMAYDEEDTPGGMARLAKGRGNEAYVKGAEYYGHAIKHYNDALTHAEAALAGKGGRLKAAEKEEMAALQGAVWGNLAAIYLARGKHITVLHCCDKSLHAVPGNVKVLFRAAKSSLALGRAKAARDFVRLASVHDPDNAALRALGAEADAAIAVQRRIAAAAEREYEGRIMRIAGVRKAVEERGMRVGPPMYRNMRRTGAQPYVDEHDVVHWPLLLLYPQHHQSDWLEDVSEVTPLSDILAHVLGEEGSGAPPPAWDGRGEYRPENVDVFFLSNPCKPTAVTTAWQAFIDDAMPAADRAAAAAAGTAVDLDDDVEVNWGAPTRMVRVPPAAPLMLPLVQPTYVTADIPVLYVVARSSDLYGEMRRRAGGRFPEVTVPDLPPPPT